MARKSVGLTMLSFIMMFSLLFGSATFSTAEEPQYGGTLTILDVVAMLNPISWDNEAWVWKHGNDTGLFYEHLFEGDLDKGPRGTNEYPFHASAWIPPSVMKGELVESYEVQKDPLALIFHLRKGVYWQEKPGVMEKREFVADDVVYSMNRITNARKAIPTYVTFVEKWEAKDKHTVVAHLKEWNANWAYRIGWGYYDGIQPPEVEKAGAQDWKNVAGTGPFMLTDYKTGHSTTYERNKDYWGKATIDGKEYQLPFVDKVQAMIIKDPQTRSSALTTGKVDLAMTISKADMESIKKSAPDIKWKKRLDTNGYMLVLRMDTKPFDDVRVRRALNLAVNQQEIIDSVFEGEAELVNYPYPVTFKEVYTPYNELPPVAQELFSYNPEKAKKLLAEAGYPNGFTFKAQVANTSTMDVESMVVAYLAQIGVTLELEPLEYPSHMSMMFKKTHGPGYFFSNDHGNPFATIRKNFVTGQTWNPYMMSDKHIDETFFKTVSDTSLSQEEGFAEMKKLAVYAMAKAPAIWLPGAYYYVGWWPWVKNYHGEIRTGAHRPAGVIKNIWIDQEMKKKMGH